MPELNEVLEDVQREVKRIGEDVPALKKSVEKDLADVRKLAEEAGKKAEDGTQLKADLEALQTGVAEKHAAIEATVKKIEEEALKAAASRMDDLEKKLNRIRLGGGAGGEGERELKGHRDFHKSMLSVHGQLKVGTDISDEAIKFDEIKAYESVFPTYLRRDEKGVDVKAMSVGSDPDGGYLVTPTVSARMLKTVYESSPMRELAMVETISTDEVTYPIDDGEAGFGWVGETETRDETTTPQVGTQGIPVHEMYAKPKATQKLLEDASIDIEGWLGDKIGQRFGRGEATAFVTGNGVKKPRGFLTYPSGSTRGSIEQVVSGAAAAVTFDGLINLTTALKEFYAAGASFLMRRATVGKVLLLKDGNGQYIWRPNAQAGKPSILLGHEVREAADMPVVGAGNLSIAFGNWREGYTIVDRLGVSTLRDPYTGKPFVIFYTRRRVGGDVTNYEAIKIQKISA